MKLSDLTQPFRRLRDGSGHAAPSDSQDDLGFGSQVITSGGRLINQDGSFNIVRRGYQSWAPYQHLVEMSWKRFALMIFTFYVLINVLFAFAFMACGRQSVSGVEASGSFWAFFFDSFFLSVQTFTTVGYGALSPIGFAANAVAALDALTGLMSFALATGLVFARFSKPKAQILFSEKAIITPYRHRQTEEQMSSLQFRIVNTRNNKLINLEAKVVATWLETQSDGTLARRFATLPLERDRVTLLPLNWTIVHPITKDSPLYSLQCIDLIRAHTEILILLQGYDDTFAQNVHTTSSYTCHEIEWNVKFARMYYPKKGHTLLELDRLDAVIALEEEE